MGQAKGDRGRGPLDGSEAAALAKWIESDGEPAVLEETGLSRLALARCIAELSVLPGTRSLARAALARKGAA